MTRNTKIALVIVTIVAVVAALLLATNGKADAAPGKGQETCAQSDGWEKFDGLSGHTFTYPNTVPVGYTLENCVKYSTTVVYGVGPTVTSDGKHEISHASFRLVKVTGPTDNPTTPTETPTPTTPTPTVPTETPTVPTETPVTPETPVETDNPGECGEEGGTSESCEDDNSTPDKDKDEPVKNTPNSTPNVPQDVQVIACVDGVWTITRNGEVLSESGSCVETTENSTPQVFQETGL